MNDPHVVALLYSVHHGADVDYSQVPPGEYDADDFRVRLSTSEVRIEMKTHFASHETAKALVDKFLTGWELETDLTRCIGELSFRYRTAEVIDRAPTPLPPGTHNISVDIRVNVEARATVAMRVIRGSFPSPRTDMEVTNDVENMWIRFRRYKGGRGPLADAAYYCLTTLEQAAGGSRPDAATKFGISIKVLGKVGNLTETKGGLEGRKAKAVAPYTDAERAWLEQTIIMFIRRAAQVAHDPATSSRQITMSDLPAV